MVMFATKSYQGVARETVEAESDNALNASQKNSRESQQSRVDPSARAAPPLVRHVS